MASSENSAALIKGRPHFDFIFIAPAYVALMCKGWRIVAGGGNDGHGDRDV